MSVDQAVLDDILSQLGGSTATAYRVLVTGSRTWDDAERVNRVLGDLLAQHGKRLTVVHGACPKGADALADAWCATNGVTVERHPADWATLGKSAGHRRNFEMVDTRPDEVVAFMRGASPGTSGCIAAARLAGLNVRAPYEYDAPEVPLHVAATDDAIAAGASAPWRSGERESLVAAAKPWCRAQCGERLEAVLVDNADGSGLHMMCDEPQRHLTGGPVDQGPDLLAELVAEQPARPAQPDRPPTSTITELRAVLIDYEANRPRSMQKALGPSELGTPCQAQIARKLVGAPRRPIDAPTWAPFQGTAVHASMELVVAHWNAQLGRERWLAEDDLEVDKGMPDVGIDPIRGHGDAFDQDNAMVVDWKHVGTTALTKLRTAKRMGKIPADQVSAEYRVQAHLYGLGHAKKGRPVRWVRLVLLARSWQYDDSDEWTEAYDEDIAFEAIHRYYGTFDLLDALQVKANPAFIAGVPTSPSSDACKWCAFHRPGQPSDWGGCAGDVAATQRREARFADGLIAT